MAKKNLIDGLQIMETTNKEPIGLCKDCIFGKQTNQPYDEKVTPEKEVLE